MSENTPRQKPRQGRFTVSRQTLLVDRVMTWFVKAGGALVMAAVFAIFLFIFIQVIPLFSSPKVEKTGHIQTPLRDGEPIAAVGTDEWGELPFFLTESGTLYFADIEGDAGSIR
ncbi:MAG: hypothetical protein ACLFS4_00405, partial [Opitutales bacterium]